MMQSFQIDDDQKETWRTKGFLLIPALLPEVLLTELKWEIYALYLARFEMPQDEVELGLRVILDRYESHKTEWRQCANRLGSLPALARIAGAPELLALAKQLDLSYPIFSTSPELRIDMPGDDQYRQPWHQDWRSGQSSFNAITMWFPLHSIDADLGPLSIVPGSHQHGLLASEELTNPRRFRISDTRFICDGQL
jgi:ectoine hydroxylase